MRLRHRIFLTLTILSWPLPGLSKFLYHGDCSLKYDPAFTEPVPVNICANANAGTWITSKSKAPKNIQPPILHHADGDLSLFLTPWVSLSGKAHSNIYISRETGKTVSRDQERDMILLQIGNNALSRHRLGAGRGRPVYRIDHNLRRQLDFAWGLEFFEAPDVDFVNYTYDNHLDWTVQASYGKLNETKLNDRQQAFGAVRGMYDIAALEGTRIVVGGFGDGLLRRSLSVGLLNVNGKGDETALEFARTFGLFPYDPNEFRQLIRLSYLSHEQDRIRYKFQYDDYFRHVRLGGMGVVYNPMKYAELECQIGYAKHEDTGSLSHWFAYLHAGVHL